MGLNVSKKQVFSGLTTNVPWILKYYAPITLCLIFTANYAIEKNIATVVFENKDIKAEMLDSSRSEDK